MAADTLRFRPARRDDVDAIRGLVRAAYAKWVPLIGREPMPMRVDYAVALTEHDFDLLCDGDTIAGLIETEHRPDHLWIENVAVHPDRQGQGLGKRLLKWAEKRAEVAGTGELRLLTNEAFEANIKLYKKVGYKIDRTEPFHLGGTTVYMSKSI
jgi:ribosomal protein S18 acetylase RimI-like enzyme